MNYRTLGCTSLKVSELCLEVRRSVSPDPKADEFALFDTFRERGGNFILLASTSEPLAAHARQDARSSGIARWQRARAVPRDDLVLAAAVAVGSAPEPHRGEWIGTVRHEAQRCVDHLDTDYLDLLVCRWTGAGHPPESLRRGLDWLVREGVVRYVAFAGLPPWRAATALREGLDRMHCRISALEAEYSLLARTAFETELEALCREQRLGFLARAAVGAWGSRPPEADPEHRRRAWTERSFALAGRRRVAQAVVGVAQRHGCSFSQVALRWVLHHPTVTSAIISVRSPAEVADLTAGTGLVLDRDELVQLHRASALQHISISARAADGPTLAHALHTVRATPQLEALSSPLEP